MESNLEKPWEYEEGGTEFLGCKIDLSRRVLIPRTETEFWVEFVINKFGEKWRRAENFSALDIFAGSVCVGAAVAKKIPGIKIDFVDCDPNAVEQIKINIDINGISDRARVMKSNLFDDIGDEAKYDVIFANPPYIDVERINEIQPSVLNYEPGIALFGGKDGLETIDKFLQQAKNFLKKNGVVFMEFDPLQKDKINELLIRESYNNIEFFKDQFDEWRFVGATRSEYFLIKR